MYSARCSGKGLPRFPLHFNIGCISATGRGLWALKAVLAVQIC